MIWILSYLILSYPVLVCVIKFGNWFNQESVRKQDVPILFWSAPITLPILTGLLLIIMIFLLFEYINTKVSEFLSR